MASIAVDGSDDRLSLNACSMQSFPTDDRDLAAHIWLSFVGNIARLSRHTLHPDEAQLILAQCIVERQANPNGSMVDQSARQVHSFASPRARLEYLSLISTRRLLGRFDAETSYFDLVWNVIKIFASAR